MWIHTPTATLTTGTDATRAFASRTYPHFVIVWIFGFWFFGYFRALNLPRLCCKLHCIDTLGRWSRFWFVTASTCPLPIMDNNLTHAWPTCLCPIVRCKFYLVFCCCFCWLPQSLPTNNFPLSKQHELVLMLQRAMGEGIVKSTNITKGRPGTWCFSVHAELKLEFYLANPMWGGGGGGGVRWCPLLSIWRSLYLLVPKKTGGKVWSKLKCGRGGAKWWVSWGPKGGSKRTDLLPCTSFRQCLVIRGRGEGRVKYLGHRHHHYCWNRRLVACFCGALVLRRTK